jgi:hypothetical protein
MTMTLHCGNVTSNPGRAEAIATVVIATPAKMICSRDSATEGSVIPAIPLEKAHRSSGTTRSEQKSSARRRFPAVRVAHVGQGTVSRSAGDPPPAVD